MPHPKVSFLYFMETSSSYGLLDIFKFCLFHIKRYFIEHTQFEQKQMIRGKHMAAVQQMVQLVNYFLHHHQPALERAFQKYISSHWTNQLELVFQVFASSPSFNSTSACNPVYWLHDSSWARPHSLSVLPQWLQETSWQIILNKTYVPRKSSTAASFPSNHMKKMMLNTPLPMF